MTQVMDKAKKNLITNGYLDIEVDPTLDLVAEIQKLKKEKNIRVDSLPHEINKKY